MIVYVLIREDQNEYGFVDTSITGVFRDPQAAREQERLEQRRAREQGLIVEEDDTDDDWQVSWSIQEHPVS